jgi:small-conductance mechanosensitive channel
MTAPTFLQELDGLWAIAMRWFQDHTTSLMLAAATAALLIAIVWIAGALVVRRLRHIDSYTLPQRLTYRVLSRTKLTVAVIIGLWMTVRYGMAPEAVVHFANTLLTVALVVQGAIWLRELILAMVEYRAGAGEGNERLGTAMGLIRLLVNFALFAIAAVVILDNLGINVTGLVAGLGIGGIAIGLAAQGIFSELFAALAIIFDKPFKVGDVIQFDTLTGQVEAIGLKSTRIRAANGDQVIISNTNLLSKQLHNLAEAERRRVQINFGLVYKTQPDRIRALDQLIAQLIGQSPKARLVRCGMTGFGPSSLDYEVAFDLNDATIEQLFDTRHRFCLDLLDLCNREGYAFAYPTQTTYTAAPDGTLVMPWAPPKG